MFRRIGIVVPLYSHVTKSTPTPSYHPKHPKSFDPPLRKNPTIPYPNSPSTSPQKPQQNKISPHYLPLPYLTPHSTQTLINSTQINKISPKTPYSYNIPIKIFPNPTSKNNPNKTLLKLRIISHTPKISTLI